MRAPCPYRLIIVLVPLLYWVPDAQAQQRSGRNPASYALPKEYTIGGITVEGVTYLDPEILVTLSGLRVGDKIQIPGEKIPQAIKTLWDQHLLRDIQILADKTIGSTIFLVIKVKEAFRLSKYSISGGKKSEIKDIREQIRLVRGRVVSEDMKRSTAQIIQSFYEAKGFLNVQVDLRETPDELLSNSVKLHIKITKGNKVKIAKISLLGNQKISDRKLKKMMKGTHEKAGFRLAGVLKKQPADTNATIRSESAKIRPGKEKRFIRPKTNVLNLFKKATFVEADYEQDKQNIIKHYNSLGYLDARLVNDTVITVGDKLMIIMQLEEGNQYRFGDIGWKGNTKYSSVMLGAMLGIRNGDIYNTDLLEQRLLMDPAGRDISSLYMDDGYLFFRAEPMQTGIHGDRIDLNIRIYEGPQVVIRNVRIYGNTKTKDHVIQRELRTLPGNTFSRTDLVRSQRELANLGFFDPESMEVKPIPDVQDGTVDIEYHLTETSNDQLELSAGWGGTGVGITGTIGLSFNNFSIGDFFRGKAWTPLPSGDGQIFSIRAQTSGRAFQSYNISFTEPWLGGSKPNSFTVSYFHNRLRDTELEDSYQYTNGATVLFGTRLKWPDDFFVFQTGLTYERYSLSNWLGTTFIISDGVSNNLALEFRLARNSVDKPIFPTRGSSFSLSLKITPPYSLIRGGKYSPDNREVLTDQEKYKWIEYHKWRFNAEIYTPITKSKKHPLILMFAAKFGFLGYYNSKLGYSPFERYELGGDGLSNVQFYGTTIISMRGYDILTPSEGAPFFNKFTVELRFPFSTNPSATIYSLLFFEGGNFWNNIKEYNPLDMRRSFGVGVRIYLPMFGLLGFDYGIGFDKEVEPVTGFGDFLSKYGTFSIILGRQPE